MFHVTTNLREIELELKGVNFNREESTSLTELVL